MVKLGVFENIHNFTVEILKMQGKNEISEIEETDARKYLSKTVLAMGNIDVDFLKEIITRVRAIIYIGNDEEVKNVIRDYTKEKDIRQTVHNETMSTVIEAWYNPQKTFEIYSSVIYSEMELANKYMMNTGPKFSLLAKYISQIELVRNTALFDHDNYDDLKPLYTKFCDYHGTKMINEESYVYEELLEIFEENKP